MPMGDILSDKALLRLLLLLAALIGTICVMG